MADIKTAVGADQAAKAASSGQSAAAPSTGGERPPAAGVQASAGNVSRPAPESLPADGAEAQRLRARSETQWVYSTAYVEIERRAEAMREMASSAAARDSADASGKRWAQEDLQALPFVRETEREIALQAVARSVASNRSYAVAIATADAELRHSGDVNGLDVMEGVAERAAAVPEYRQAMEEVAPDLLKEADAYAATQPPGFTARAKFLELKARVERAVDVELELEADVEVKRDEIMLAGTTAPKKLSGVELGSRPPAVARAAAAAAAGAAVGVAGEAPKPGVVPPASNKAAAREAAVAEEVLEDDELAEEDEALRRRRAAEAAQSATLDNAVDARPSGKELARDEIIVPRRIVQSYDQVDGKFFAKDSSRMMFEDKGLKLATSGTNKETIADMVALARAKNWQSIKLTGAQEFRREAWLQAESQGVKTQGYTPKEADLAALKALTQERSTNMIAPVKERGQAQAASNASTKPAAQQQPTTAAARHDLNKNQAAMHVAAMQYMAANLQVLREKPGSEQRTGEEMQKLAYWRGIVEEESKGDPVRQREALERFDLQTTDPEFVQRITRETQGTINAKTVDRVQKRDTHEQSL